MRRYIVGIILIILASFLIFIGLKEPSNSRNWKKDFAVLPDVKIDSNDVFIKNIRNFEHLSGDSSILRYYDRTFNLNKLESLWFVLSPFVDQWRGPAHSFLSFGFSDSQFISISVEARKEIGESYSMIGGMFKKFELVYVVGDERDIIALRTVFWEDDVFLYPIRIDAENIRILFVDILNRIQKLKNKPEFYNTLWRNCTTNLHDHVNHIWPDRLPGGWRLIFPGYSDELVFESKLIDTKLKLESARKYFRINERAKEYYGREDFSIKIREFGNN